jgi:hypothetical protein
MENKLEETITFSRFENQLNIYFGQIESILKNLNKSNDTSYNVALERWLIPTLNRLFNLSLIQEAAINAPAVDLTTSTNKLAIQITSEDTAEKIKKTVIYNGSLF